MYIFVKTEDGPVLFHLLPSDRWFLASGMDVFENAHISLHYGNEEYPLHCSTELTGIYPNLTGYDVLAFYETIIQKVFDDIRQGHRDTIDVAGIYAALLPDFLNSWMVDQA